MTSRGRQIGGLALLLMLVIGFAILRLLIDRNPFTGEVSLQWPGEDVRSFRITALAVTAIVGVALATSGVLLQALLRNPLASPFVLGLSSGAGLGVMIFLYITYRTGITLPGGDTLPAVLGALAALAVVYTLGQRRGLLDPLSLILIGVVISTICGAGIMLLQHLVDTGLLRDFTRWLMGTIPEDTPTTTLLVLGAATLVGTAVATLLGRSMDAATLSDEEAQSVGVPIKPLRVSMFLLAGVLTAMTVALAGPIAFVGLIAPHAARLLLGSRHTVLVIGSALVGMALLTGADVARQSLDLGAGRMPVGIFTALIGGPAFLWLLLSGKGQS